MYRAAIALVVVSLAAPLAAAADDVPADVLRRAAQVRPTPQQVAWQELEFICFAHFGVNTFTDREWGEGAEDPAIFNPSELDADQWVAACKAAGMKLLILTAKHHDGFCLWPSRYTEHCVKNSPWRGGKGDVVREVADACRRGGLRFGVYLSPWDRHEATYGSDAYNAYYMNQLRELLTQYGEITEVWWDGACGEGPNGKKQVYDWEAYTRLVRQLQPDAVIFNQGPDVRWVGNEDGLARENEWSVLPAGQRQSSGLKDLGNRKYLAGAEEFVWFPAECDVSIRPGWFYHADQDDKVKSLDHLLDIYYRSVGRNSVLLLNIPPDRRGLFHENDVARLRELRAALDETFGTNLASGKPVTASATRDGFSPAGLTDSDPATGWAAPEGTIRSELVVDLGQPTTFDRAMLQEEIRQGQRVERFSLEAWDGQAWKPVAEAGTIGYKRLLRFDDVTTSRLRITILDARDAPILRSLGLYKASSKEPW